MYKTCYKLYVTPSVSPRDKSNEFDISNSTPSNSSLPSFSKIDPNILLSRGKRKIPPNEEVTKHIDSIAKLPKLPHPSLLDVDSMEILRLMYENDDRDSNNRNALMMSNHPKLISEMRTIILDWLMQVCNEFKLLRVTYYLTVDYFDRYLFVRRNIEIKQLQLIAIACLFVASKVEEIYPPEVNTLADISDGGCTEAEILQQELLLLQALNWRTTNTNTVINWLGVYMQISVSNRHPLIPKMPPIGTMTNCSWVSKTFPAVVFDHITKLTDLCSFDINMTNYRYSVIAASAICLMFGIETALFSTGFKWSDLEDCVQWMEPFYHVILDEISSIAIENNQTLENKVDHDDSCLNQNYVIRKEMLKSVKLKRQCIIRRY